jgi:naphthalene 1,2-dioxygenase system ferredoxin subunit
MSRQWIMAVDLGAVPENDVIAVAVGGRDIALYGVAGEIFATDNACTHGNARLCDGFLEGEEIECPLHQGRFNVRTGKAVCAPLTADVRSHPVKVVDGKVFVLLSAPRTGASAGEDAVAPAAEGP